MIIYLDMDEVICDMLTPLCKEYSKITGQNFTINSIEEYCLKKFPGIRDIFLKPGFFINLKPVRNSIEVISQLYIQGRHELFIASDPGGVGHVANEKLQWIEKYLPFLLPKNVFLGSRKELLRGDLIFDDNPNYIEAFNGISVIMDKPYNKSAAANFRVKSWSEFFNLIKQIEKNKC